MSKYQPDPIKASLYVLSAILDGLSDEKRQTEIRNEVQESFIRDPEQARKIIDLVRRIGTPPPDASKRMEKLRKLRAALAGSSGRLLAGRENGTWCQRWRRRLQQLFSASDDLLGGRADFWIRQSFIFGAFIDLPDFLGVLGDVDQMLVHAVNLRLGDVTTYRRLASPSRWAASAGLADSSAPAPIQNPNSKIQNRTDSANPRHPPTNPPPRF